MESIIFSVEKLGTIGFVGRTLVVGLILYITSRFSPNRAGGQYTGYDFTFFWMMGGLIVSPLYDSKINFLDTVTAAVTIIAMHYLISFIAIKSRTFAKIVYGKAEVLISQGIIQKKNMFKSLIPIEILLSQLREIDAPNINEVETAIFETNGRISVLKKADYMPVTPADLNIPTVEGGLPSILINDGKVIDKNLEKIGHDRGWLACELKKYGVIDMENVYLATIDGTGTIYYSLVK
ncbi:Uncharacterized membrane protein YcaP, DUF421 family [Geosporobacter subterraneus DSM 17957]|uniref:Uncharacterized membrane protein YcaP, DUF421 family n=1 Tax=Geosporobacter subterraneus DSM 17957 TaxID=1121919 RepID=A0A1M6HN76_9FIRM|nr:DUF421 domain-containing protein [Geosporobacter subterraneus]SHJ23665.1 Uncharacterized membrane protein YcaP, DUF421 family [Geosporobacter subterraneus DSM 17957]